LRDSAGISLGQEVEITLERDDKPREEEVPPDLGAALRSAPKTQEAFDRLSHTHRKVYAVWITEAKKQETRDRRIAKAIEMLTDGVKHP
jgi:uncharacterized protein YdeI (YjbR/CyaY-like superfamily)